MNTRRSPREPAREPSEEWPDFAGAADNYHDNTQGEWTQIQAAERDREKQRAVAIETELLRNRYATRGAPGPRFRRGTPRRTEPVCRPYSVAEFAAIVERANKTGALPQSVGPQPSVTMNAHPDRHLAQVRRTRPEPIPWGRAPPQADEVCAYDRAPGRRPWPPWPTFPIAAFEPPRLVFPPPPPRPARPRSRPAVAPYLASIDTTLKELDAELVQTRLMTPFMDRVTRVLERLEQREAREARHAPAVPTLPPRAMYTSRPVEPDVPETPPERQRNTLHRYYQRSIDSPPASEASRGDVSHTPRILSCCKMPEYHTAKPVRPVMQPSEDGPHKRVYTAASEAVSHPPVREGYIERENMSPARLQCAPPADMFLADDHARADEDVPRYTSGGRDIPMGHNSAPQLVVHAEDTPPRPEPGQISPPAYDWRLEPGNAVAPYGRPKQGDTYTGDGNTFDDVGGPPHMQQMNILTRWLDQLPGQLRGTHVRAAYDDYVRFSRPVVSPIPHHNRWEQAALQYAGMDLSRDGVIRISTPTDVRDDRDGMVPYRADPQDEVYDGGGIRLPTYRPNPNDERPVRRFDINIATYKLKSTPVAAASMDIYDGGGDYPPRVERGGSTVRGVRRRGCIPTAGRAALIRGAAGHTVTGQCGPPGLKISIYSTRDPIALERIKLGRDRLMARSWKAQPFNLLCTVY